MLYISASCLCFLCFTSYGLQQLPSGGHQQNAVMPGVCYGDSLVLVIHGYFPRKRQDAGRERVSKQLDRDGVCLQQAALPVVPKGSVSEEHLFVQVAFAHQGEEQVAARAQEDQRRPAGHLQLVPQTRFAVVHHRMADVVAEHSAADVVQNL